LRGGGAPGPLAGAHVTATQGHLPFRTFGAALGMRRAGWPDRAWDGPAGSWPSRGAYKPRTPVRDHVPGTREAITREVASLQRGKLRRSRPLGRDTGPQGTRAPELAARRKLGGGGPVYAGAEAPGPQPPLRWDS